MQKKIFWAAMVWFIAVLVWPQILLAERSMQLVNRSNRVCHFKVKKVYFALSFDAKEQKKRNLLLTSLQKLPWKKYTLKKKQIKKFLIMPNVHYLLLRIPNKQSETQHFLVKAQNKYALEWTSARQKWVIHSY